MFNAKKLKEEYKGLIGFRKHYDNSIVIPDYLTESSSGEYYNEKSGAIRLDYISACLPKGMKLEDLLEEKIDAGISGVFNDILQYRQVNSYGKTLLERSQLLNRNTWSKDTIVNRDRLVGMQIYVRSLTGLTAVINEVGLQLTGEQEVKLYLFHSQQKNPLEEIVLKSNGTGWAWNNANIVLSAFESNEFQSGTFYLCYYQEDLIHSAVNYSNFNWDFGECGTCNNARNYYNVWKSINNHFMLYPFYIPEGSYVKGKMFDTADVVFDKSCSYGLNLRLSVQCDLTQFFIDNKMLFKNLLALKVTSHILNFMKFSSETNYVEEQLKMMILRDLEGDKETNYMNVSQQYNNELKAVNFNIGGINNSCLDNIQTVYEPTIGVL